MILSSICCFALGPDYIGTNIFTLWSGALTNFWPQSGDSVTFVASGRSFGTSATQNTPDFEVLLDDNLVFDANYFAGNGQEWTLGGSMQWDGTNLYCSAQMVTGDASNMYPAGFITITNASPGTNQFTLQFKAPQSNYFTMDNASIIASRATTNIAFVPLGVQMGAGSAIAMAASTPAGPFNAPLATNVITGICFTNATSTNETLLNPQLFGNGFGGTNVNGANINGTIPGASLPRLVIPRFFSTTSFTITNTNSIVFFALPGGSEWLGGPGGLGNYVGSTVADIETCSNENFYVNHNQIPSPTNLVEIIVSNLTFNYSSYSVAGIMMSNTSANGNFFKSGTNNVTLYPGIVYARGFFVTGSGITYSIWLDGEFDVIK